MENQIYKELWEEFLQDKEKEEDDDEYVKIKDSALQRLLLDYEIHMKSLDEGDSNNPRSKLKRACNRIGFRSFVQWVKMNNIINQSEKGKLDKNGGK